MKTLNSFVEYIKKFPPGIFLVIMTIVTVAWMYLWENFFWGQSYNVISLEELLPNLLRQPIVAFKEEIIFRFAPFTIMTTLLFIGNRIKINPLILILLGIVFIIGVQIQFGLAHVLWDYDLRRILEQPIEPSFTEKMHHIVVHGGMGIIISFVYFKYLLQSRKLLKYIQIIPLFMCIILHMISSVIIIILSNYHGNKKASPFRN